MWFKTVAIDLGRGQGGPGRGGQPKTDEERARTHGVDIEDLPPRGTGVVAPPDGVGRGQGGPGRHLYGPGRGRGRRPRRWLNIASNERDNEIIQRDIALEQAAIDEYEGQLPEASPELRAVLEHLIEEEKEHRKELEELSVIPAK